jgi:hypothetical protein
MLPRTVGEGQTAASLPTVTAPRVVRHAISAFCSVLEQSLRPGQLEVQNGISVALARLSSGECTANLSSPGL